jgi:transposase
MIRRVRELTRAITKLHDQLAELVVQTAPQLLTEPGIGALLAAKFIGEIAGINRFTSDAQLARLAGCAPIPVSSGRTDRHRLDPGGKTNKDAIRSLKRHLVYHLLHDPTAVPTTVCLT